MLDRSKIYSNEFAYNVLISAALLDDECCDSTARAVADLVPDSPVPDMMDEISRILAPDFRHEVYYGGREPEPDEADKLEQERRKQESRIIQAASAIKAVLERGPT